MRSQTVKHDTKKTLASLYLLSLFLFFVSAPFAFLLLPKTALHSQTLKHNTKKKRVHKPMCKSGSAGPDPAQAPSQSFVNLYITVRPGSAVENAGRTRPVLTFYEAETPSHGPTDGLSEIIYLLI